MNANMRSIVLMLVAPPLVLLLWAHFLRPALSGLDLPAIIIAGLIGAVGAATAPWPGNAKVIVTIAYLSLLVIALPFLSLLAVCSTGDCL